MKPIITRQAIAQRRSLLHQAAEIDRILRNVARLPCRCARYAALPEGDPEKDLVCSRCQAMAVVGEQT